jgi:hypothetical protein
MKPLPTFWTMKKVSTTIRGREWEFWLLESPWMGDRVANFQVFQLWGHSQNFFTAIDYWGSLLDQFRAELLIVDGISYNKGEAKIIMIKKLSKMAKIGI